MTKDRPAKPKVGNLVRGYKKLPYPGLEEVTGIIVDTRGLEVCVLSNYGELVWIKRTEVEVLQ